MKFSKSFRSPPIQTLALAVLLLPWASTISSDPQMIVVACSRKVIESYPGAQSRPVLRLLDESKVLTDEFMSVFANGRPSEIHERYPQLEIFFNQDSQGGERLQLPAVFSTIGSPVNFEYRSDEALYSLSRPQIEPRGTFATLYRLGTNKAGGNETADEVLVVVETRMVKAERQVTLAILYGAWAEKQFSEARNTSKCSGMESGLRIGAY